MKRKSVLSLVLCGLILVSTGYALQSRVLPADSPPPTLVRTDFVTELNNPWDMAFTSDMTMFFTERCRGLSVRKTDGTIVELFGMTGYALEAPDFFCEGQSGMNGVALDPAFATNRTLYVYMSSNLSVNPRTNRVVRLVASEDFTSVSDRVDIVTDISYKDVGNSWGNAGSHSGGRIRFGPDGFLYITTGDNHNGILPQDLTQLGGKILRVDGNGVAAPGNNTPAGGDPRIYTYGHRNTQGITFHPVTGRVFIAEHGPDHSDEVTALTPGGNGGWDPKPDRGVICSDEYCGYISNKISGFLTPMTDLQKFPDAMKPMFVLVDAQGMGPATFLWGSQWKSWENTLLVSVMASMQLYVLQVGAKDEASGFVLSSLPLDRMRSLVQAPDGNLYIATDTGSIWKVVPQ